MNAHGILSAGCEDKVLVYKIGQASPISEIILPEIFRVVFSLFVTSESPKEWGLIIADENGNLCTRYLNNKDTEICEILPGKRPQFVQTALKDIIAVTDDGTISKIMRRE